MHLLKRGNRGFAVETVILVGALVAGAGWFGVREFGHAVKEMKQERAVTVANEATTQAKGDAVTALASRDAAAAALATEKATRAKVEADAAAVGKTIQRSAVEGAAAAEQLPESRQRDHLLDRFSEIDEASRALYGNLTPAEIQGWRQLTLDALAGKAEAQERLDRQMAEIKGLNEQLLIARTQHDDAQKRADEAQAKADREQKKATDSVIVAQKKTALVESLFEENTGLSTLLSGFKLILFAVAGVWVLGVLLKSVAIALPTGGGATGVMHLLANTFGGLLSPLSVLGESRSRRETQKLVESTGAFIADARKDMPEVAKKITDGLDIALSPAHQQRVKEVFLNIQRKRGAEAAAAEAKAAHD
ncbi:MAG: hypothetical protein NTU80_03145 [Verrucomicrobia bacterium]|nr:hypothetical protein [Verrucomicrobiota bacterium]